jgi:hypothetical protein
MIATSEADSLPEARFCCQKLPGGRPKRPGGLSRPGAGRKTGMCLFTSVPCMVLVAGNLLNLLMLFYLTNIENADSIMMAEHALIHRPLYM